MCAEILVGPISCSLYCLCTDRKLDSPPETPVSWVPDLTLIVLCHDIAYYELVTLRGSCCCANIHQASGVSLVALLYCSAGGWGGGWT